MSTMILSFRVNGAKMTDSESDFSEKEGKVKGQKSDDDNESWDCIRQAKVMKTTCADVAEYPNSYVFVVDMPGIKATEIKVQVENDNVLVVSGERKRDKDVVKYLRTERVGKFMKKFTLPDNSNSDKISAVTQDGVLTVTVEKLPPPEPKRVKTIEVKGS